uniref:Single stranded DNA binding protein 4 n=1 Tax=Nomascus leucogenys TaxID=61853 RepID=A0A2I3HLH0_NOMLE
MYAKGGKGSAVPSDSQARENYCLSLSLPSRTWPPGQGLGVCTAQKALHGCRN